MKIALNILLLLLIVIVCDAQNHPNLILTKAGVEEIKSQLGKVPEFDESLAAVVIEVDAAMEKGINVPMPKDLAGGYTHEQHKLNFFIMQKAGVLFQLTGKEKYATFIKDMLLEYAKLFPTFDRHPAVRSYARGKFFWQCLNDANWLVYTSQAYDCIYDWLDNKTRKKLNNELFKPYADFLSVETPQFFNRIHNHSTWGNAAVGMIALVIDDDELLQRTLYGLKLKESSKIKIDNDGGAINISGESGAGFLAQIDHSFSPDGYYTEGPYYQRYAIYPFLIFAQALATKKPDLEIFKYRDSVLIRAVYALIEQTNGAGEFFPINDAQKGMSLNSRELITAVNLAYAFGGEDPTLLSIIKEQGQLPLNDAGMLSATAISEGKIKPYKKHSLELTDGANGDEGAIGILRFGEGENELSLLMKYCKHGMGHGHFDKLSFLYNQGAREVFPDYGSARWVNIEQKDGGGYLMENNSWAKQTIAHNTLVVNGKSQFGGDVKTAEAHHGLPYLFDASDSEVQVMSALEPNAYKGVLMQRTMAMIKTDYLNQPLILDLYRVASQTSNSYDMPFHFNGDIMSTNFKLVVEKTLSQLGEDNGYQHLWKEATGNAASDFSKFTWYKKGVFYTLTTTSEESDQMILGRLGAADPNFNLRSEPVLILRRPEASSTIFASTFEIHGNYTTVTEVATDAYSKVKSLKVLYDDVEYTIVKIQLTNDENLTFAMANKNADKAIKHSLKVNDHSYKWEGPFKLFKN